MSWGEIAGLLAALAALVFVGLSAVPLLKLGRVLDELRVVVRDLGTSTTPILDELKGTVSTTSAEIARLSEVTQELAEMSHNASQMTKQAADVSTVMSTPVVKTAEVFVKGAHAVGNVGRTVRSRRPKRRRPAELPAGSVGTRSTTASTIQYDRPKDDHESR